MRARYCIQHQLGFCQGLQKSRSQEPGSPGPDRLPGPLYLVDEADHRYRLRFDCGTCEMEIIY